MEIIDSNNVMITIAQSLAADKRTASHAYDVNSLRKALFSYLAKYLQQGKKVVMAVDSGSWRKTAFVHYKARRAEEKERSDFDYKAFLAAYQAVVNEFKENAHFPVIEEPGCEGDDIIFVISVLFLDTEEVTIHSTDKDLLQLQTYFSNVRQFSPRDWKFMTPAGKGYDLIEHLVRGDSGDGVPNVLSDDRVFVDRVRQTVLTPKRYQETYDKVSALVKGEVLFDGVDEVFAARFARNKKLIDLREIPEDVVLKIIAAFEAQSSKALPAGHFSRYLASHGIV